MDFVSIRVITDDVARLAGFYEKATGVAGRRSWVCVRQGHKPP
jgi:hypothetical protein